MCPMEGWLNVVAGTQGFKGVFPSRDSRVFRVSGNKSSAGIQLVGKRGIEEEVKNNIYCQ